jgi:hypothetical protein
MIDKLSYRKIELMKGCEYCKHPTRTDKKLLCGVVFVLPNWECKNFKFKDAGKKRVKSGK